MDDLIKSLINGRLGEFLKKVRQRPELLTAGFDKSDETLLENVISFAPHENRLEAVTWLLDMGADPNHRHPEGGSALWTAVIGFQTDIVKLLLSRGANPNIVLFPDEDPTTPLETAELDCWLAQEDLIVSRNTLAGDDNGINRGQREQLAIKKLSEIIRILKEAGAKPLWELLGMEPPTSIWLEENQIIDPQTGQVVDMTALRPDGRYGVILPLLKLGTPDYKWLESMGLGDGLHRLLRDVRYSHLGRYRFKPSEEQALGKLRDLDLIRIIEDETGRCAILSRGGAEWLIEYHHALALRFLQYKRAINRLPAKGQGINGFSLPLEIREHEITEERVCYYCEKDMDLDSGPEVFIAGTNAPVCWNCVCLIDADLAEELEDAKAHFFRSKRGTFH